MNLSCYAIFAKSHMDKLRYKISPGHKVLVQFQMIANAITKSMKMKEHVSEHRFLIYISGILSLMHVINRKPRRGVRGYTFQNFNAFGIKWFYLVS